MKVLAVILLVAGTLAAAPVQWETSLAAAQQRATRENKLIFLDVSTGWCSWCKKLQAETFPSPAGQAALSRVVPLHLETQDAAGKPTRDHAIESQFRVRCLSHPAHPGRRRQGGGPAAGLPAAPAVRRLDRDGGEAVGRNA